MVLFWFRAQSQAFIWYQIKANIIRQFFNWQQVGFTSFLCRNGAFYVHKWGKIEKIMALSRTIFGPI